MTNKSTHKRLKSQGRDNRKKYIGGGIIILFIALSPYLFYLYESFPKSKVWETSFFIWKTAYVSWYQYAWILIGKLVPLYLLLIWFFTCKHWWHWVILVPIFMYIFQAWGAINQSKSLDEVELIYMIPVMLVIIPAVYLIRAKLFNQVRSVDMKEFEEDLKKDRTLVDELKELFR